MGSILTSICQTSLLAQARVLEVLTFIMSLNTPFICKGGGRVCYPGKVTEEDQMLLKATQLSQE